jgi:DNA-binding response OmpR family regulator
MRILLADDDPDISEIVGFVLKRQGYQVVTAANGTEALEVFRRERPDLIVLDVMMPRIDGYEVCRRIRASDNVPIIMLTAKDDEIDKVTGLDLGADDYLTKPFGHKELLARIRAVLRRSQVDAEWNAPQVLAAGPLKLDSSRHAVHLKDKPVDLTPTEFQILRSLMINYGRVVSHETLLNYAWGSNFEGETEMLKVHIRHLREKLEAEPSSPTLIKTVRGVGYRLADDV